MASLRVLTRGSEKGFPVAQSRSSMTGWPGSLLPDPTPQTGETTAFRDMRRAQVFEALTDAVLVCDVNGVVVDCNRAAEVMFSNDRAAMLGRRPEQFAGMPAEAAEAAEAVEAALHTDGWWGGDVPLPGRAGGIGASMVVGVHDRAGRTIGFAGIHRDVTQERRTAVALGEAEQRWRSVLELAPTGLALAGLDGRFELVNPALCRLIGYRPEQLLLMTLQDITHPDDRDTHLPVFDQLLAADPGQHQPENPHQQENTYQLEKRYLHAQGHVVWGHVSLTLIHDQVSGRPQVLASVEDITARKHASERLAAIIASANDAFVGISATGQVSEWNHAAERLFGWSRDEVLGAQLAEMIVPPELRAAHTEGLGRLAAGEPGRVLGQALELEARTRDDARIPVELTVWRADSAMSATGPRTDGAAGAAGGEFYAFIRDRTAQVHAARQQAAIAAAQLAIADTELSPLKVMNEICRHAKALTGADIVTLELQEGPDLVCKAATGASEDVIGVRTPITGSLSGMALSGDTALICTDTETDDRVNREACRRYGTRSIVVVPLRRAGIVQGILKLAAERPARFSDQDAATLTLLAAPFGAALVNALSMEASYRQASTDQVTGLGNRAYALTHLEKALLRLTRRGRTHTALLFLDLDRFKQVNDTHGHHAGDRVLAQVAKNINSSVRVSDTTARYGGDEFVIICEDLAFPEDAHALARRLITNIAGTYTLTDTSAPPPHPPGTTPNEQRTTTTGSQQ